MIAAFALVAALTGFMAGAAFLPFGWVAAVMGAWTSGTLSFFAVAVWNRGAVSEPSRPQTMRDQAGLVWC